MGRLSLFLVLFLITFLLAGGCGSKTTETPVSSASAPAASTGLSELDIDAALLRHVINTATTDHGKVVLGKLLKEWSHGYGHGPFQQNQDGSWLGTLWIEESKVKGNDLLEPVFAGPVGTKFILEWDIDADAQVFTPRNENAKRLEVELGK